MRTVRAVLLVVNEGRRVTWRDVKLLGRQGRLWCSEAKEHP